jgi:hypothetical protein
LEVAMNGIFIQRVVNIYSCEGKKFRPLVGWKTSCHISKYKVENYNFGRFLKAALLLIERGSPLKLNVFEPLSDACPSEY